MIKAIKKAMEVETRDYKKKQLAHYKLMDYYTRQANCTHDWEYREYEPPDDWGFDMPQRIICKKCGCEIWNATTTHKHDLAAMKHILIDMDIEITKPLER
jgi:hypothetical protein